MKTLKIYEIVMEDVSSAHAVSFNICHLASPIHFFVCMFVCMLDCLFVVLWCDIFSGLVVVLRWDALRSTFGLILLLKIVNFNFSIVTGTCTSILWLVSYNMPPLLFLIITTFFTSTQSAGTLARQPVLQVVITTRLWPVSAGECALPQSKNGFGMVLGAQGEVQGVEFPRSLFNWAFVGCAGQASPIHRGPSL